MDWIAYFDQFFSPRAEELAVIIDAAGCREGWVQGEMFLHGRDLGLRTNATRSRFDLLCPSPPMIAEIKICGGGYAQKMRGFIEGDVQKLSRAAGPYDRFMILIVDSRITDTPLGRWLTTCDFPHVRKHERCLSGLLAIRIWQTAGDAQGAAGF